MLFHSALHRRNLAGHFLLVNSTTWICKMKAAGFGERNISLCMHQQMVGNDCNHFNDMTPLLPCCSTQISRTQSKHYNITKHSNHWRVTFWLTEITMWYVDFCRHIIAQSFPSCMKQKQWYYTTFCIQDIWCTSMIYIQMRECRDWKVSLMSLINKCLEKLFCYCVRHKIWSDVVFTSSSPQEDT